MAIFLTSIFLCLFMASSIAAQGEQQLTRTLLPAAEKSDPPPEKDNANLLWIQAEPAKEVFLQFDLSGLPAGLEEADLVRCTLRLAAKNIQYTNRNSKLISVTGQVAGNDLTPAKPGKGEPPVKEIVSLSTLNADDPQKNKAALNSKADVDLRRAVFGGYKKDRKITLLLHTGTFKASSLFYSRSNTGGDPSNIPRLVIEYKLKPEGLLASAGWPQQQQNPEHTGRQPWIPFRSPANFCLQSLPLPQINNVKGGIVDYPLIYRNNLYFVGKYNNENYLFSLDFTGRERWRCGIGAGTLQRSPVISKDGIIYVMTENQLAAYSLGQLEKTCPEPVKPLSIYPPEGALSGKPAAYTDLTIGNDGSLFLALNESNLNFLYGFTPDLKPFLKAGPFPGDAGKNISTITVSRNGRKIFAQVPAGAVVIDVANPSDQQIVDIYKELVVPGTPEQQAISVPQAPPGSTAPRRPFEYYHVPVAGNGSDVMIFSDFPRKEQKSNIWGYSTAGEFIWNSSSDKSLVSSPVGGSDDYVYYIQDGQLQRHQHKNIGRSDVLTKGDSLNTSSNLVMDGADNIYFWNNGLLHGYKPDGAGMFKNTDGGGFPATVQRCANDEKDEASRKTVRERRKDEKGEDVPGPEQFIRLMMGPDGALWTNNKNGGEIFVFQPLYDAVNLTLREEDIKSCTSYRASGILSVGDGKENVTVKEGMQLLFQAQEGVGFAKGFRVEKGASIYVRTGF